MPNNTYLFFRPFHIHTCVKSLWYGVSVIVLHSMLISCEETTGSVILHDQINDQHLFQLLAPSQTNVDFINEVKDGEHLNILTYRNFYNGGGVSIGDINNDGYPDLFFTANAGKNRLYLNQGNLQFEDITDQAGVGGDAFWSTGSTMVDINHDGWLDIYVCNSGDVDGKNKENELLINNQDLTFTNRATAYQLNNQGFSTHASFFDYDLDGDLDCYLLNNSFKQTTTIDLYKVARNSVDDDGGDKLYRNDGGRFTDVTTEAGLYSSKIGFGLGVSVSDLNNDMLPDIYVSNDFWERDYLYINQGNGTFTEELNERLSVCSMSSMGADIADINNDGTPEIFTTDMLAADNYRLKTMTVFDPYHVEDMKFRANYHYQMLQNCLHLNNGQLNFQEVGFLAGVAATDWSWGALLFDFDNDGNKDIYVSNGIAKDILYQDFSDFIADKENIRKIVLEKGRVDWRDFLPYLPATKMKNYAFTNMGDLHFENRSDQLGLGQPSFSNGAAYGDLDNDGDLDLVVNNVNMTSFIYENTSERKSANSFLKLKLKGSPKNLFGIGAKVEVFAGGVTRSLQNFTSRGFESSVEPVLTFGLGESVLVDSLQITWPDGRAQGLNQIKTNQVLALDYSEAADPLPGKPVTRSEVFEDVTEAAGLQAVAHQENGYNDFDDEQLLHRMLSTEGPGLVAGDLNGDLLTDLILLGGAADADKVFFQQKNGRFRRVPSAALAADRAFESTCGHLLDLENDGDLDLVIGSGGNEPLKASRLYALRVYENNGKGQWLSSTQPEGVTGNFSTIQGADVDGDGYEDLFVGARVVPGNYGVRPQSLFLQNNEGQLQSVAQASYAALGMVTDAAFSDYDQDGDQDLIVVGDWMPITILINDTGIPERIVTVPGSSGWWNAIEAEDLDGDGDEDYVLGNWGLNSKFRASPEEPLTMYVKDFDENGKSEFVINWRAPLDHEAYPFATKKEMTQQLPLLKKSVLLYDDYAKRTYESLFLPSQRSGAQVYMAETLASSILWNETEGLVLRQLPQMAQVAPVLAIAASDFDGDGSKDIWLGGNLFNLKPQVGRLNSSRGVFLKGVAHQEFVTRKAAGLEVRGEVRDVQIIPTEDADLLVVARNNDALRVFQPIKRVQ